MTGTRVIPPRDMPDARRRATAGACAGKPRRIEPFFNGNYMLAASNLASTVEDLAKYASLQFRTRARRRVADPQGHRRSPRCSACSGSSRTGRAAGASAGASRGATTRPASATAARSRASHADFVRRRRRSSRVIALTNSEDGQPSLYVNQAYAIVAPAIAKAAAADGEAADGGPRLEKYEGVYVWEDEEIHVAVLDGKLTIFDPPRTTPGRRESPLEPVSGNVFRQDGRLRRRRDRHVHHWTPPARSRATRRRGTT